MFKKYAFLPFLLLPFLMQSQSMNMSLLGSWNGAGVDYNDIWGYVDGSGNEYALIGSLTKVHVVKVSGGAPSLVGAITGGASSVWRDIKTYGSYAYAVADHPGTNEGLIVINLGNLPSSISLAGQYTGDFTRAHNIFIDQANARLYVAGSSGGSNSAYYGLIVYDLSTNPANPTRLASISFPSGTSGYIHDVYVRNNIAYCSHGTNGLWVHNLTNVNAPVTLGGITPAFYPQSGYNHSGWLSDDGNWYVFADETHGKALKIADVSDFTNINVPTANVFQNCLIAGNTGCIPHNPFILGNLCFVSYYHDGLKVFDISNPAAVTMTAYYDTYPSNTDYVNYQGAWGAYPYLPSGKILISDISTGLKVVQLSGSLPIDLVGFNGEKTKSGSVELSWYTHSEANNAYFEVQHSADGRSWSLLEKVNGRGNANDLHKYKIEDKTPFEGQSFYRLKQVDFDGKFSISAIVSVKTDFVSKLNLSPSIFGSEQQEITVQLPKLKNTSTQWHFSVYDFTGRLILEKNLDGEEKTATIAVSQLNAGSYVLKVSSNTGYNAHSIFVKN